MKKFTAITLALMTAVSLSACGGSGSTTTAAPQTEAKQEASSAETKQEAAAPAAGAEVKFPTHTIEVHTHKSGSTVEINTRLFTPFLSKYLDNVDIIVVNDDSMYTAFQNAINADPDGYCLAATTCNVQLTDVQGGLTYDSVEDGRFIGTYTVGGGYFVALTKKFADEHNVTSFDELVKLTQDHPDDFTISTSYGAISELATYSLIEDCGVKAFPVDLADSNTRLIAFLEGDLDIFVGNWSTIEQYVETGEVVPLCFYGEERSPFVPDYPCTKELGYEVMPADNYYYLTCPKETPDEIVSILAEAVEKAATDPEFIKAIENNSARSYYLNPEDTYNMLKEVKEALATVTESQS